MWCWDMTTNGFDPVWNRSWRGPHGPSTCAGRPGAFPAFKRGSGIGNLPARESSFSWGTNREFRLPSFWKWPLTCAWETTPWSNLPGEPPVVGIALCGLTCCKWTPTRQPAPLRRLCILLLWKRRIPVPVMRLLRRSHCEWLWKPSSSTDLAAYGVPQRLL